MADKKISQLTAATTPLAGTEVLPIVQSGATKKITALELTGTTVDSFGNVNIPAGNLVQGTAAKGINFTANTPAAGMTSQLLNWYEEGTWTPEAKDSEGHSFTASVAVGRYVRVGSLVVASCTFSWSSLGSVNASPMILTGLPFTSNSTTNLANGVAIGLLSGFDTAGGTKQITANLAANKTFLTFHQTNDNAAQTDLPANAQSTSGSVILTVSYVI